MNDKRTVNKYKQIYYKVNKIIFLKIWQTNMDASCTLQLKLVQIWTNMCNEKIKELIIFSKYWYNRLTILNVLKIVRWAPKSDQV